MSRGARELKQGNCILLGEYFQEIASFPTGSFTFGSNIDLGAVRAGYEVESHAAQDGQVVLRLDLTDATVVPIQEPVD